MVTSIFQVNGSSSRISMGWSCQWMGVAIYAPWTALPGKGKVLQISEVCRIFSQETGRVCKITRMSIRWQEARTKSQVMPCKLQWWIWSIPCWIFQKGEKVYTISFEGMQKRKLYPISKDTWSLDGTGAAVNPSEIDQDLSFKKSLMV